MTQEVILRVMVKANKAQRDLAEFDQDVAGEYTVVLPPDAPREHYEAIALDAFSGDIPVECPEDFDLTVTDSAGKIVTDSLSGTAYEHDTWALSVEKTY